MTLKVDLLLPVALEAISRASELVQTHGPGRVTAKGDRDMASEVDYAAERVVRDYLRHETPEIGILGEEEGATGNIDSRMTWAIDPVDGTANFVRGIPLCGTSLGLMERDRPVLGVIDLPFLDLRYHAVEGGGAFSGEQRITSSQTSNLRDAIVSIGDYAVGNGANAKNRLRFALTEHLASTVQRIRMLGSAALDLAWVAEGRLDASVTLSNKPWDTAAGVIIAREAGAVVLDLDGSDHTFDSAATIAVSQSLADDLINLIQGLNLEAARRG